MKFFHWIVVLGALAGCASTRRPFTYPQTWPDADVVVGTHRYQVWFHDADPTILLERGDPASLAHMLSQNMTLYAGDLSEPEPVWRAAADAVLRPIGCQATRIVGAGQMREAYYECAGSVNVPEQVGRRRSRWRDGVRVEDPTGPQR